jgi:chromate transport protein ChrA
VLMFVAFLLGLQPHAALGATIAVLLVLLPLVLALELLGVFAWLLRGPR